MTDQQIADLGLHARNVLENPAFNEAMKRLHDLAHQAFKKTDLRDAEGLKLARQFQAVTDDFEAIMRRMVEGGKMAQIKLDQHRDESRVKRVYNRFTR